jgi:membrane fusion protein (multidrug efflux system)
MHTETENIAVSESPEVIVKGTRPALIMGFAIGLGALFAVGALPKLRHAESLRQQSQAPSSPSVIVETAEAGPASTQIVLPTSTEALRDTPIYARTNGYLKSFAVDIGAHVEAGQVLAEIETPEIDEQLRQARAALAQAQANLGIAQITFERWGKLFQTRAIAAQDYDERKAQVEADKANVAAAEANVQRLTRMQEFQKVLAPYSGTITERHTDIGALVSGDSNSSRMLFRLAQADTLRVFVNVPQSEYRLITQGVPAALSFREFPGRTFAGKVVRTAGALDPITRTLRTEVQVPNGKGELIPGLYAEVKFNLLQDHPAVVAPSRAVIIQANGPQIATIDTNSRVVLRAVGLGRDFGKTVEITTGLEPGARFITNPTDTLRDGTFVRVDAREPVKIAVK